MVPRMGRKVASPNVSCEGKEAQQLEHVKRTFPFREKGKYLSTMYSGALTKRGRDKVHRDCAKSGPRCEAKRAKRVAKGAKLPIRHAGYRYMYLLAYLCRPVSHIFT